MESLAIWGIALAAGVALAGAVAAAYRRWLPAVVATSLASLMLVGLLAWELDDETDDRGATAAPTATVSAAPTAATDSREGDYERLALLAAGITLERFVAVLGPPLFVTPSRDAGGLTQSLFQGREFWVQAISDASGTVHLMAVTSCSPEFKPAYRGVAGSNPAIDIVVLQETRMDQTGAEPNMVHYSTSGATANSYYYDEYYFGNPGLYKTYFTGVTDGCQASFPPGADLFLGVDYRARQFDPNDARVAEFRAGATINTYAETSAFALPDIVNGSGFQVGADRILTRTAPPFADVVP